MQGPSVVAALCMWALVAAGAGPPGEGRTAADASAQLRALGSLSPAQEAALASALAAAAQRAARDLLDRLEAALALSDEEREELLAEAAAAPPGQRSLGGGGNGEPLGDTIRRTLHEGLPERGIPPLDPFRLAHVPINVDIIDVLWLKANLNNLSLEGLADFQEDVKGEFKLGYLPPSVNVNVDFDVIIPQLLLSTQYDADGFAEAGLAIWGDGPITFALNRLRVKGSVVIRALISVQVQPCDISITARSVKLDIEGLFGGGLLSQLAGEIVSDMINEMVLDKVFDALTTTVEDGVCGYLRSQSVSDLIAWAIKITSMPLPDSQTTAS